MVSEEPAAFSSDSLEALDVWCMIGRELRLERLPVVLAAFPDLEPNLLLMLLRIIDEEAQKTT